MSQIIKDHKSSQNSGSQSLSDNNLELPSEEPSYYQPNEYNVERILNMREQDGTTYYLVKWEGYPENESTWEPIQHLQNVLDLVEEFQIEKTKLDSLAEMRDHTPIEKMQIDSNSKGPEDESDGEVLFKKRRLNESYSEKEGEKPYIEIESSANMTNKLQSQDVDLFEAKVVVKGDNKGPEKSFNKNDKEKREKRRLKGSQIMQESRMKKEMEGRDEVSRILSKDEKSERSEKVRDDISFNETQEENIQTDKTKKKLIESYESISELKTAEELVDRKSTRQIKEEKRVSSRREEKGEEGSFKFEDKPKKILATKEKKSGGFRFLIEWHTRKDGIKPKQSYVDNEELKDCDPKFLLEFYESKIIVLPKEKRNKKLDLEDLRNIQQSHKSEKTKSNADVISIQDSDNADDETYASEVKSKKRVSNSGAKKKN